MDKYMLGFSVPAFIVLVLFFLPRAWWKVSPPKNDWLARNYSRLTWVNRVRTGCLTATFLLLLFVVDREHGNALHLNSALVLLLLFLVLHYWAWLQYQRGKRTPFLLIFGIVLLSSLYLLAAGMVLDNRIAMLPAAVYGIFSFLLTWKHFGPK